MADEKYTLSLPGASVDQAEAWAYQHRNSNPTQTEADLVVEVERAKAAENALNNKMGNLADLSTDNKTSLVAAINEAAAGGGGGGGGASTAAKVSYNNTGTGLSGSNVQTALTEVNTNVQEIAAQVWPLTCAYASNNAGTYEVHRPVTPTATLAITRKGADVKESATVRTNPDCNVEQDNSGWSYLEISSGTTYITTEVTQGGQTVEMPVLIWDFTYYRYRGEVDAVPTDYAAAIKALSTKELTTSASLGSTALSAGKYYLFAVKGVKSDGSPLDLVVKHAQTGGTISGCVLGVEEIPQEYDASYSNDYTYVLIPASTDAWNFTISL